MKIPKSYAKEILGVQPMTSPQGKIFSIAMRYSGDAEAVRNLRVNITQVIEECVEWNVEIPHKIPLAENELVAVDNHGYVSSLQTLDTITKLYSDAVRTLEKHEDLYFDLTLKGLVI